MSINVYLKGEEVTKLDGFTKETKTTRASIPNIEFWNEKGRWHIRLYDLSEPVPPMLANIVDEISFHGKIPFYVKREAGIYCHNTAKAEVDFNDGDEKWNKVFITAKNMEDLREVFRMIKIGSIRPEQSYGGEQTGLSRAELETEKERSDDVEMAINCFFMILYREKFPFCTKKGLIKRFYDFFDFDVDRADFGEMKLRPKKKISRLRLDLFFKAFISGQKIRMF